MVIALNKILLFIFTFLIIENSFNLIELQNPLNKNSKQTRNKWLEVSEDADVNETKSIKFNIYLFFC